MAAIRKLTIPYVTGSSQKGMIRGLAASVEAFETPVYSGPRNAISGFQSDIEALRTDVGRAKTKITREARSIHSTAD